MSKTPEWTIPKQSRPLTAVKSTTPGSGTYEYKSYIGEGPEYSMRPKYDIDGITEGKKKSTENDKTTPGPCTYDPIDRTHGPYYTIGNKREKEDKYREKKRETPAPGSYNLAKDFNAPGFKFDNEKRSNLEVNKDAISFPSSKYIYNAGMATSGPKWTFSKVSRFGEGDKIYVKKGKKRPYTPGPGSYEHKLFMGKEGPLYSFVKEKLNHADVAEASLSKKQNNFPCPGSYHKNITYRPDTPQYSISKLKESKSRKPENSYEPPGPDKYNPNKFVSSTVTKFPVWTVGKGNRYESEEVKGSKKKRVITPGPGNYTYKNGMIPLGPKYSIGRRFKDKKRGKQPGPGSYEVVIKNLPNEPSYRIGTSKRDDDLKVIKKNNYPAPNAYQIKDSRHTHQLTFPKDQKDRSLRNNFPGPGTYRIPCSFDYISDLTRSKGVFDPKFRYVGYEFPKKQGF